MLPHSLTDLPGKAWWLLATGPALFLLGLVGASLLLNTRGVPETEIPARGATLVPHVLLGMLLCLALILARFFAAETGGAWRWPGTDKALADIAIGLLAGTLLGMAYLHWLAPVLETLQRSVGDYVPPGSVLPAVSGSLGLFFVANVLLAPWVEETLYRGVALPLLGAHVGTLGAVVLSCIFFGLLHWAGGVWYMLLTGCIAGGAFAALFYARGGVLAPFAAHLALNLVEFVHAWHARGPTQP